jgi:hypothetical protein
MTGCGCAAESIVDHARALAGHTATIFSLESRVPSNQRVFVWGRKKISDGRPMKVNCCSLKRIANKGASGDVKSIKLLIQIFQEPEPVRSDGNPEHIISARELLAKRSHDILEGMQT